MAERKGECDMTGDMIINLYLREIWRQNLTISIRQIFPSDKQNMMDFMDCEFSNEKGWKMEVERGWCNGTLLIAVKDKEIIGFICYDCTGKGYLGPFGVSEKYRRQGIGKELLYACLDAMKIRGYGYGIVGWVSDDRKGGPATFYKKVAKAEYIPFSNPHYTLYKNKVSMENETLVGYEELDHFRKYGQ